MNDASARGRTLSADADSLLPPSWAWAKISEVAILNPIVDLTLADDREVSFVRMAAVEERSGRLDASATRRVAEVRKGYTRFLDGDVLLAKITPCMENGKFALASRLKNGVGTGSTEFHVVRPAVDISARYLLWFFLQDRYRADAAHNMKGTAGQKRVPQAFIEESRIPVAPQAEQERIVARIDELFSRIDAGVESLKRAKALLGRYRQAVLKAAVTGELTRDWRKAHGGRGETGGELLRRILAERRRRWEEAELAKLRAKGKTPKDNSWKRRYVEPASPDTTKLPVLPEGWVWATFDALAEIVGGVTVDAKRRTDGYVEVPYLRVANVQRGFLDLTGIKKIKVDPRTAVGLRLQNGDILLNEGGDLDKLGRGWVWQDEIEHCIHQNHVFRARLFDERVHSKFASHYTNEVGRAYFLNEGAQTTNLASISRSKLCRLPIPVPPAEESNAIIARCDDLVSVIDTLIGEIDRRSRHASSLRQAVLQLAFSGRLVPQDPSDEPASVLLERIRAERVARGDDRPRRGRRPRVARGEGQTELVL